MYVRETQRLDYGWNHECDLRSKLCKCRNNDPMPKDDSSNSEQAKGSENTTTITQAEHENLREARETINRMTRNDRPSLSKKWACRSFSSSLFKLPPVSTERTERIRALRPITKDHHHQDSLFGNSFQSKSFYVVHPEWISETVDNTDPQPLHRPPWPWEQPRYRQNIQIPITYKVDKTEENNKAENQENAKDNSDMPMVMDAPMCLPIGYTFTHPGIDLTKPYEKQTQFGAPLVDTSVYKLSY